MKTGRPKATLTLTTDEVAQLHSLITARSIPHSLGTRARMIVLSHEGLSNGAIAEKLGVTEATVGKWRHRFIHDRLAGLHDELRPGRPRARRRGDCRLDHQDAPHDAHGQHALELSDDGGGHRDSQIHGPSHRAGVCAPASSTAYL